MLSTRPKNLPRDSMTNSVLALEEYVAATEDDTTMANRTWAERQLLNDIQEVRGFNPVAGLATLLSVKSRRNVRRGSMTWTRETVINTDPTSSWTLGAHSSKCVTRNSTMRPSDKRYLHHCSFRSEKNQRTRDKLITLMKKVWCQLSPFSHAHTRTERPLART